MDTTEIKKSVRNDFKFAFNKLFGILLYGSIVKGEESEGSDIDICVVAPEIIDKIKFARWLLANIRDNRYDVRVFELMPLYLKMEVIEHGEVIYARNVYELYEYLYTIRKFWDEQKERQRLSPEEALRLFSRPYDNAQE